MGILSASPRGGNWGTNLTPQLTTFQFLSMLNDLVVVADIYVFSFHSCWRGRVSEYFIEMFKVFASKKSFSGKLNVLFACYVYFGLSPLPVTVGNEGL